MVHMFTNVSICWMDCLSESVISFTISMMLPSMILALLEISRISVFGTTMWDVSRYMVSATRTNKVNGIQEIMNESILQYMEKIENKWFVTLFPEGKQTNMQDEKL